MTKVLLDTDIGSDIDDALCLAYLLARSDCELLGITTVSGDVGLRAALASTLCRQAGEEIPIALGAERALFVGARQPDVPQAAALNKWSHATTFGGLAAVDLLRQAIMSYPSEVVLLTIGPLTNIARLVLEYPEAVDQLKGVVSMGGSFGGEPGPEWNIWCDPHAAEIVFRTTFPEHVIIGLDVTKRLVMQADQARARLQSRLLAPVLDFAGPWFRDKSAITFHDPLAAMIVFDRTICRFQDGRASVEFGLSEGVTRVRSTEGPDPHRVAVDVDPGAFFERFIEILA